MRDSRKNRGSSGPLIAFFGAVASAFAAFSLARAALPGDMTMPIVATVFFGVAATTALVAVVRPITNPSQVTWFDTAGALALIGCFAAFAIEPEQLVRLVGGEPQLVAKSRQVSMQQ